MQTNEEVSHRKEPQYSLCIVLRFPCHSLFSYTGCTVGLGTDMETCGCLSPAMTRTPQSPRDSPSTCTSTCKRPWRQVKSGLEDVSVSGALCRKECLQLETSMHLLSLHQHRSLKYFPSCSGFTAAIESMQ